jgi:hypothetical protein
MDETAYSFPFTAEEIMEDLYQLCPLQTFLI